MKPIANELVGYFTIYLVYSWRFVIDEITVVWDGYCCYDINPIIPGQLLAYLSSERLPGIHTLFFCRLRCTAGIFNGSLNDVDLCI